MNPYAEIEVTPLYSHDGMASEGKSVRIADEEEHLGWKELGVVSSNYLLVHNARVKEVVDLVAERSGISDWNERKSFFDGRRFIYLVTSDSIMAEVSPGDLIRFGLIAYNSYDGSRALSLGAYAEHLVCSNGMTSETYFARFVFRHHKGNINWDEQTERAFASVMSGSRAQLTGFASTLQKLQRKTMTVDDLKIIRKEHLGALSVSNWGTNYGDCDGVPGNGCEVDKRSAVNDCGACDNDCTLLPHVDAPSCVNSLCNFGCDPGWGNCTAGPGCETQLNTNTHCGGCGTACARAGCVASCTTGSCELVMCNSGFDDCNLDPDDGCEPLTTLANCGACGDSHARWMPLFSALEVARGSRFEHGERG